MLLDKKKTQGNLVKFLTKTLPKRGISNEEFAYRMKISSDTFNSWKTPSKKKGRFPRRPVLELIERKFRVKLIAES